MRRPSALNTVKAVLFVPVGIVGGCAALWRGFWLEGVSLLGVALLVGVNLAADRGLESPAATKLGCLGGIVAAGGIVLLMVREVAPRGAWWPAFVLVVAVGVAVVRAAWAGLTTPPSNTAAVDESRRLHEMSGSSAPERRADR